MIDYHVSTPAETQLVMQTAAGRVVDVWPTPSSSVPGDTALVRQHSVDDENQATTAYLQMTSVTR